MILLHTESMPILAIMFASVLTIVGIFVLKFHLKVDGQKLKSSSPKIKQKRK